MGKCNIVSCIAYWVLNEWLFAEGCTAVESSQLKWVLKFVLGEGYLDIYFALVRSAFEC